jgi:hypothetical protein
LATVTALAACSSGTSGERASSKHPTGSNRGERPAHTQPQQVVVASVAFVHFDLREQCQWTADAVGYPVPCPTMLPAGTAVTPVPPQAHLHCHHLGIVAPGNACGPGAGIWRGWIAASSQTADEHLVLHGAPAGVHVPANVIFGPAWWRAETVKPLGAVRVAGRTMHWYHVRPKGQNEGTEFEDHLILVWNQAGHTYAYGFHVVSTFADMRALDLELVRHLVTIDPRPKQ